MRQSDSLIIFLTGLGIGVAAAVLLSPGREQLLEMAKSAGDTLKKGAGDLSDAGQSAWADLQKKESKTMNDLKDRAKQKLDGVADATRSVVESVVDKSRDTAHSAGKIMEAGGRHLQNA